jgi:DNA-directed RNA polymerase specialized sigma24 family protein
MQQDLSSRPTSALSDCCRRERNDFHTKNERSSPCCGALFRRAFNADQEAWAAIDNIFNSLLQSWARAVLHAKGNPNLLDADMLADAVQEAKFKLSKDGSERLHLVPGDDISVVLEFWRTCTKNEVLMLLRKISVRPQETTVDPNAAENTQAAIIENRQALRDLLNALLETEDERLVTELLFHQGFKPAEIAQGYPERFPNGAADVSKIAQRLRRRFWKDPLMRDLAGLPPRDDDYDDDSARNFGESTDGDMPSAPRRRKPRGPSSLEIQLNPEEAGRSPMNMPCALDESILFEYVVGLVSTEQRAAIESSPACLMRAQAIAAEVARIEQLLYRVDCPEPKTLIEYQERRTEGMQALVIRKHVEHCEQCKQELAILAAIDAIPLTTTSPLKRLRSVVEAMLQPAPQLGLRGQTHIYEAPQVLITLSFSQTPGGRARWTLTGELTASDGGPYEDILEVVELHSEEYASIAADLDDGTFTLRDVPSGRYRLVITTPDAELTIKMLSIGLVEHD